jgi:hypothetical protein
MDAARVGVDVVLGVNQALQGEAGLGRTAGRSQLKADRSQLDHPVREVTGRLAVQGHEAEVLELGLVAGPFAGAVHPQLTVGQKRQLIGIVKGGCLRGDRA